MELGFGCSQECTLSQFAVPHACLVIQWWFISLVHEGPDMRTSPAICQAGDLLLWKPLYGPPAPATGYTFLVALESGTDL